MANNGKDKNGRPLSVVGKPFRKVDARAKCTGQTKFADDIFLPRMLYCKILRSHLPHALIKNIDLSKALALPGVIAVITGKDLPIPYGILPVSQDEHALCIDKVRFIGDPVAAVEAGFAEADLVREDTFFYEGNTHLPMEQHAAVAHFDSDEKLTLWSATQTPHYVHRALTKVLEIPASHIRVIATPNGGGFGGKS